MIATQNWDRNRSPDDPMEREESKCIDNHKIQSKSMGGRSLSNSLTMMRPFSSFSMARRRKNISPSTSLKANDDNKQVDDRDRKESIDQTVLLMGDADSRRDSHDFSRSFDVDGSVEFSPPSFSDFAADNGALYMKPSMSEPSFLNHHPDGNGLCACRECSAAAMCQEVFSSSMNSHPSLMNSCAPGAPPPAIPQQYGSPKSNDTALQARIEGIRIQQQLLGDNHPDVIFALSSLAKLHRKRGNHAEAASILSRIGTMRSMIAKSSTPSGNTPQAKQLMVPTEISFPH